MHTANNAMKSEVASARQTVIPVEHVRLKVGRKQEKSVRYAVLGKGLPEADTPVEWDKVTTDMDYKGTHGIVCN